VFVGDVVKGNTTITAGAFHFKSLELLRVLRLQIQMQDTHKAYLDWDAQTAQLLGPRPRTCIARVLQHRVQKVDRTTHPGAETRSALLANCFSFVDAVTAHFTTFAVIGCDGFRSVGNRGVQHVGTSTREIRLVGLAKSGECEM
jgi:hypothetical protein